MQVVSKLQWSKLEIAELKGEFAGLKMGLIFGPAFLGKSEKYISQVSRVYF